MLKSTQVRKSTPPPVGAGVTNMSYSLSWSNLKQQICEQGAVVFYATVLLLASVVFMIWTKRRMEIAPWIVAHTEAKFSRVEIAVGGGLVLIWKQFGMMMFFSHWCCYCDDDDDDDISDGRVFCFFCCNKEMEKLYNGFVTVVCRSLPMAR